MSLQLPSFNQNLRRLAKILLVLHYKMNELAIIFLSTTSKVTYYVHYTDTQELSVHLVTSNTLILIN